jgi:hypothetical protein
MNSLGTERIDHLFSFTKTNLVIKAFLSLVRSEQGCPALIFVPLEVKKEKKCWSYDSV